MSHRHCLYFAACLCWTLLMGRAYGQVSIPSTLRNAASIDGTGLNTIQTFVRENAAKLADSNADTVSKAREALVEASRAGASPASPAYAARYAEVVAVEMGSILDGKGIRPRLNAAVVLAKVAEATSSPALQTTVMKLMDDAQPEFMQLWGMKAAKPIMSELIRSKTHQKLLDRMLAVVKKHPTGPMTQEVYSALTRSSEAKIAIVAVEPLLILAQTRVEGYKTGTPEDPDNDAIPFGFLTQQAIWSSTLSAKQRLVTMQLICDLLSLGAQRADEPGNKAREQIATMINKVAQGVAVVASVMGWKDVEPVARRLAKDAPVLSNKTAQIVKPMIAEIKKIPEFSTIQEATAGPAATPVANP